MDEKPKYADLIVGGVVAKSPDNHRKTNIALQRAVDGGGGHYYTHASRRKG